MKNGCWRERQTGTWISRKWHSRSGMTLTELLAGLLILSMTALVIGGGVVAVKDAYQKVTNKSEAQQVLVTTVELMTEELAGVTGEKDGGTFGPRVRSGRNGKWMYFSFTQDLGICRTYEKDDGSAAGQSPLLSGGAMADRYYTAFESYSYENGCFTVKNLAVYRKQQAAGTPAVVLPELKVRAVNLEGL